MKSMFYPKLAWMGIRKNSRLYIPYILASMGMVMMYYIVAFLNTSSALQSVPGGEVMQSMLGFGMYVIAAFSLLFLFYTNSFLWPLQYLGYGEMEPGQDIGERKRDECRDLYGRRPAGRDHIFQVRGAGDGQSADGGSKIFLFAGG